MNPAPKDVAIAQPVAPLASLIAGSLANTPGEIGAFYFPASSASDASIASSWTRSLAPSVMR